jgi:cytochrome P450
VFGDIGDIVTVSHLAQGRDRAVFGNNADTFDPIRNTDISFAFGYVKSTAHCAHVNSSAKCSSGLHACPGRNIALTSMETIVGTLRPHLRSLESVSALQFDRPSLADREFAWATLQ